MSKQAHFNPKSMKWLISFVIMIVVSAIVVGGSFFLNKMANEKATQPVELDFTIASSTPMSTEENELDITGVEKAFDDKGNHVGYVIKQTVVGYNQESPIQMATTLTKDGAVVCSIEIIDQEETEYLGVRIVEDGFKNQFNNRKLPIASSSTIQKGSKVDVISGSTISSEAVIKGVNNAQEYVTTYLAE